MAFITPRKSKKHGMRYTARIRLKIGATAKEETQTFSTRREAAEWGAKREKELLNNTALEANKLNYFVDQYIKDINTKSINKIQCLKRLKNTELAETNIKELKAKDYYNFFILNSVRWSKKTAKDYLLYLGMVLQHAKFKGYKNEFFEFEEAKQKLKKDNLVGASNKRDRRPTREELNKILNYLKNSIAHGHLIHLFLFTIFSARRSGEVRKLEWADVDLEQETILIRDIKHPTQKINTRCLLPPKALAILKYLHKQKKHKPQDLVFNCEFRQETISHIMQDATRFLNIKDLRFHDFRHEGASYYAELGYSIPQIATITGHKDWSSLQRYAHLENFKNIDKWDGFEWLEEYEK